MFFGKVASWANVGCRTITLETFLHWKKQSRCWCLIFPEKRRLGRADDKDSCVVTLKLLYNGIMTKGLLFKTLLFIAESRGSTPDSAFCRSLHSRSSKSESPKSEWSSESASSTPPCKHRMPQACASAAGTLCDDLSALSSGSESDQVDADSSDAGEGNLARGWSDNTDCSLRRDWGDATLAPWLGSESPLAADPPSHDERVHKRSLVSSPPANDACPVCVRPMSCMETLFAPSCGYLCHLSCMQRTLRNNLDNERGNRPLEINAMRCPICFALHPLAHGVQFSDVRGQRFVQVTPPPIREDFDAGSPKFLPGEQRRVLQPQKAAHIRGYASEADGLVTPKRSSASFSLQALQNLRSKSCNSSPSAEPQYMHRPGAPQVYTSSPLSKGSSSIPPRPRLRSLQSAPAQLYSAPQGSPGGYVLHVGTPTANTESRSPADQVSKRLADFYQITTPPRSTVSRVVSFSSLERTMSA
ncbi:hypothetical protein KFL_002440070 [Klebsormidium nitens]|uniref:RING-type domain-containing protein n=1 Tax=Klebsormidium nitens TaxID=105231 RepID=A0A1Y1I8Y6_KLENI|nr:hypothetical protein KFL_002440070 [Klebsormidium nitens]|eukprot:GAQ85601.1 hypothetical protein KFL_002440070 [Klebsormidium nitens]